MFFFSFWRTVFSVRYFPKSRNLYSILPYRFFFKSPGMTKHSHTFRPLTFLFKHCVKIIYLTYVCVYSVQNVFFSMGTKIFIWCVCTMFFPIIKSYFFLNMYGIFLYGIFQNRQICTVFFCTVFSKIVKSVRYFTAQNEKYYTYVQEKKHTDCHWVCIQLIS